MKKTDVHLSVINGMLNRAACKVDKTSILFWELNDWKKKKKMMKKLSNWEIIHRIIMRI